ncbi:Tetratricopeptide repeat [Phytophthora infestans]|nr:Tetratricopeptide repeat [Phytophthora infestans]
MRSEIETQGTLWWDEQLVQPSVSFRAAFFPALLCVCDAQSLPSELSRDELRVVTKFCVSHTAHQSDQVTKEDFRRFIARFGPLEFSLSKLVACFCINRELVPWFHGEIGRDEAESVLSTRERSDGAFLVRFSESHPTKFTLTYLKIHSASSNTPGRRELKNCLVNNLGAAGYALTEAVRRGGAHASVRQRTYPSIGAFIQSSSARLKYGVASEFSSKCNQELAAVRAIQDQQSDSYAAFSAESFGNPEPPANATAMLFSRTPPSQSSFLNTPMFNMNAGNASGGISDSYASFTLDSLAPPTVHRVEDPPSTCHYEDSDGKGSSASRPFASDYGSFAAFAQQRQPQEQAQPSTAQRTPAVSDEYASFANLASTYSHDSQQAAIRQATAFSRSPSSTIQSGFANTGAYGSFASVAVSKPTTADAPNSRKHSATDDYGSFASLADEFEDKRPQWEQSLGPPPPPMTAPASADVYGDFAALSLSNKVSTHKEQAPPPKSLPIAPNADVYGSFDPTASTPATTITPTTSALDELNVGMEFYKQKRLDDALLRFMLAQEMARSTGDQVVEARALGNLGTVYLDKKNPHQAVRCYQHCLDITRAIEDTKRERTILNNLVLALVASEDLERALSCCQVQLETTTNAMNRRKIISRMSLLREKMARQATS